jgi:hypothetical protein
MQRAISQRPTRNDVSLVRMSYSLYQAKGGAIAHLHRPDTHVESELSHKLAWPLVVAAQTDVKDQQF